MVSTRRKPSTNSQKGDVYNKYENEDDESNVEASIDTRVTHRVADVTYPLNSSVDVGKKLTSDSTFHAVVSKAPSDSNNHANSISSSDTSVIEAPIVPISTADAYAAFSTASHTSSLAGSLKQFAKKKALKPIKPPVSKSVGGLGKRFASAHTRSNAGNAQLLTGVENITISMSMQTGGDKVASIAGGSLLPKSTAKGGITSQQKGSKEGVAASRNGVPVTKIFMNTGILYIYTKTHRAEFVRTK